MRPIAKKALAAVAAKQVWDKIQEAREPATPSWGARLLKLSLIGGILGGAAYAYKSGLLPFGPSQQDEHRWEGSSYDSSVSVSRPVESPTDHEPVGAPNA